MIKNYRAFDVNFSRALFALPLFLLASFISAGSFNGMVAAFSKVDFSNFSWLTISILASYAVGDIFFFMSTVSLGVPGALAIASGFPILTAIAGAIFDQQLPSLTQWCGLLLAVSGMVLVILNDPRSSAKIITELPDEPIRHPWTQKKWVGVLLATLTAVSWGLNSYAVAKGGAELNPAVANSIRMIVAIVLIGAIGYLTTRIPVKALDWAATRKYGWLFVVEAFFGSYLFVYGLSHSSIMLGSTLASLAPVLAVPVSIALKLEQFSWVRTAAVLTVVMGLSLLFR